MLTTWSVITIGLPIGPNAVTHIWFRSSDFPSQLSINALVILRCMVPVMAQSGHTRATGISVRFGAMANFCAKADISGSIGRELSFHVRFRG
jgi:hypothetical protein